MGNSIAGIGGVDSAYCQHKVGAVDGDHIDYNDAYTIDYGICFVFEFLGLS